MRRRSIFLFFLILAALCAPVMLKRATQGFKLAKFRFEMPHRPDWERASFFSQGELEAVLRQPFSYLGKGSQCYAFASADGRYVLKLLRFDQKKGRAFQEKNERFFSALLLAFDAAVEETGLLYIHLNLTQGKLPWLQAKGPIGQRLHFPLDKARFVLQKRVDPFRSSLAKALLSSDTSEVSSRIDSFISLLERRVEKGIGNSDSNLSRNFGFFGRQAIELDFGNYYPYTGSKMREIRRFSNRLRSWLSRNAPEWVPYLDARVEACEKAER